MTATTNRILSRWRENGHRSTASSLAEIRNTTLEGGSVTIHRQDGGSSSGMYSGSDVTNTSGDFLGDWRAVNSWQQFDLLRVRNRSRQLERGNPWCIAFKRNMLNNVLGAKGFHFEPLIETSRAFGDSTEGEEDAPANKIVLGMYDEMGLAENFTTRKRLSRRDVDRLLLSRLIFDGEFILRKHFGFDGNEFNFAWQMINADYLDHNLNRIEENGDVTRMGVRLHRDFKYPVSYFFLLRRPNDSLYDYSQYDRSRYVEVKASEVIHVFLQTEDDEQVRGFPWPFAAVVNLFRQGKFEEAALVNATIGARQGVYFKKKYPDGFIEGGGDPRSLSDDGSITQDLPEGSGWELPYGVEPEVVKMQYPDAEFEPFRNAMMLGSSAVFGTSYATTTGDLSKANFVSSRVGQIEEREHYMATQEFLIEKWKKPGFDEELFRATLSRKVPLPNGKHAKFNKPDFTGRRWKFVQPVDDAKAFSMKLDDLQCAIGDGIREQTQENPIVVFRRIAKENQVLKQLGLSRAGKGQPVDDGASDDETMKQLQDEHDNLKGVLSDVKDVNDTLDKIDSDIDEETSE